MCKLITAINRTLDHADAGKLLLRVSFGVMLLLHGIFKLMHGVGGVEKMLVAKELPLFLAYGVFLTEVIAPVLIVLGLWTRIAALIAAIGMVAAAWLSGAVLTGLTEVGAWSFEKIGVFLLATLAIALLGSGRYAWKPD